MRSTGNDLVTVVVPARNEEDHIGQCLRSVLAQDHADLQVLVVDGASEDATTEIVKSYADEDPRVSLLVNPERRIPTSLNMALAEAQGPWLVRIDAHATVPADYVARVVAHLRTGRWGGVGGRKDGMGRTHAGRAVAAAMASPFGVGNSTYHHGTERQIVEHVPFGAYPVQIAREIGGWNEDLAVNQDFEFDYRLRSAGYELLFDPDLVIHWHCRQSVPDLFRQYRRYGRGKVDVAMLHPGSVRPRHLAAPALLAGCVAAAGLATRHPRLAASSLAPYAAGLAGGTVQASRQLSDTRDRMWVGPAFVAMHVGWATGAWEGLGRRAASLLPINR